MPVRVYTFICQRQGFFLLDMCYFVNAAAALFLLLAPSDPRFEAAVYALTDGPLAAALVAWQCAWLFSSTDHVLSVLIHQLPGLAVFANRHLTPVSMRGWRGIANHLLARGDPDATRPVPTRPESPVLWLVLAPLVFYLCWQALYFLIVQVACRSLIRRGGYDTSYNALARRAVRTNSVWHRLVRHGSIARRCLVYGLLQFAFTVAAILVFLPTYFSFRLGVAMQVVKLALPLWHGSRYQHRKVPQNRFQT